MYTMRTAVRDETATLSDPSEAVCTADGSSTHRTTPEARAIAAGHVLPKPLRDILSLIALCAPVAKGTNTMNGETARVADFSSGSRGLPIDN